MTALDLAKQEAAAVSDIFRLCLAGIPIGFFFVDPEGSLRDVNHRAAEIFGFDYQNQAHGKPLSHLEFFFSPEITERIGRLFHEDKPFKIDCFPGTNLKGHFAHYCLACKRAVDEAGKVTGVFGVIEDISDHVGRQQALKSRIDELSILSQISQVVSSALDTEEVIKIILTGVTARQGLGFNRAFLFLLDEDGKTLAGQLAIGPVDAEEAGNIWGSLKQDNRTLMEILSLYQGESQRTRRSLTDLIRNIRIDVTDGSLLAQAISESSPIVVEHNTDIDHVTESILTRLGEREVAMTPLVSRDRPIGLLLVDNAITHREITQDDRKFLKLIADQTAAALERSYLYQDIKERALELEMINRKLTEMQNQIIETEKMSVIGEITAAVAHELRNPLTIIGGFANMVYRNIDTKSPDAEYLNIIISETQRAESVLTDVLDFSKASKEKDEQLDLGQLAQKARDMLVVRRGNGRCRMVMANMDNDISVWGNREQLLHALYQIFWSLVEDLPDFESRLNAFSTEDMARLEIHMPNGDDPKKTEKTMRQYFGGGKSTQRLSLLVAEETLKHHGGYLGVESHSEEGPVLYIQLPRYKEKTDGQIVNCR